ncbi:MFS transporter [Nocardiopsis xinjiangensis]|uniref:MFS transporter n=1 Tax=Nocardiopsis xinjiangensis TaxID=124285 RepID=UPI000A04F1F0|nr:MFS transporter [Nocardiopsis xinjiangensis]
MSTPRSGKAGPAQWAGLAVLALPTVLLGLDLTVLHLALPSLAADLNPTGTQELWIVDAYSFLIAGFLITMGTIGDRIGRRRLLMTGGVGFVAASLAAAYAPTPEVLIAARAALGVAGATLMPSTLALISNMFHDPRQRAFAIGMWATFFAGGMAAGPLVGGVLLDFFWWGAAFLPAVPVLVLMMVLAPFLLPEYRAPQSGRFDLWSAALSLLAMLPIVYAVKEFAKVGLSLPVVVALLAGVLFSAVFVRRQLHLESPLLDMALFKNRAFSVALGMMLAGLVGVGGVLFLVVGGFSLVYLGLGAIAALGTDLVVGAAPSEKAGSAAAMSETVQELGLAAGVTLIGSLSAAVYATRIQAGSLAGLSTDTAESVETSLSGATSVADEIPGSVLQQAQEAFITGLNTTGWLGTVAVLLLAVITGSMLRHIGVLTEEDTAEDQSAHNHTTGAGGDASMGSTR